MCIQLYASRGSAMHSSDECCGKIANKLYKLIANIFYFWVYANGFQQSPLHLISYGKANKLSQSIEKNT